MNNKILASVLVIGVALMMGIGGGIAYFHDSAETSGSFEAGMLELNVIEWAGEWDEEADPSWNPEDNTFHIDDAKPGDSGWGSVTFKVEDNPAWGRVVLSNVEGDLAEVLEFSYTVENADGDEVCSDEFEMDNIVTDAYQLEECTEYTLRIDVEWPTEIDGVDMNDYQGAELEFDLTIEIEQKRHNDNPFEE